MGRLDGRSDSGRFVGRMSDEILSGSSARMLAGLEPRAFTVSFTDSFHIGANQPHYGSAFIRETAMIDFNGTPYDLLTYTSPSAKMTRGPNGTLRFQAHNLYLNSAAPANQSITVISGATYSVTITGSVSVTASGAATGTWTAGTQTFTAATGTLTLASTSGTGTVHVRRTPSDSTYLETTSVARYALPFDWALGGALNGIRIERSATNLVTRSNELATTWSGFQSSATNAAATGPDGTASLSKFFATATAGVHTRTINGTGTTNTNAYVVSCFVKAAEHSNFLVSLYEGTTLTRAAGVRFNTATQTFSDAFATGGAASHSYGYEDWGGGIYRVWMTCVLGGTDTQIQVRLSAHDGTSSSFTGDGSSGIYIGGVQLDAGTNMTSPVFTHGASVTRVADALDLSTSAVPFSSTQLTLFAQFKVDRPSITGTWTQALAIDSGTSANRYFLEIESATYKARAGASEASVASVYTDLGAITQNVTQKVAMSVSGTTSCKSARNGIAGAEDTAVVTPTGLTSIKLGFTGAGNRLDGILTAVATIPRAMSQAELNAITT